ncbi:TonB system transport protein ExbD [Acidisoma sp. 7E03]
MALSWDEEEDLGEKHEINVTPFIDVMLVLLIIFMVAAPLATVDVLVDLPTASTKAAPRPDTPIFLTLQKSGALSVNDTTVAADALIATLDRATKGDHDQRLYLRADKDVPYGMMMTMMEQLQRAGYLKIGLVAQQTETAE